MIEKNIVQSKNIKEYTNAKIIITFLVIIGHVTRMYTSAGAISMETNKVLAVITNIIYLFHMPMFMLLSGAIYAHCISVGKYRNYKEMLENKFKRLMIPYFFWGIVYVAPIMVSLRITTLNYIKYVILNIFLGGEIQGIYGICGHCFSAPIPLE